MYSTVHSLQYLLYASTVLIEYIRSNEHYILTKYLPKAHAYQYLCKYYWHGAEYMSFMYVHKGLMVKTCSIHNT